MKRSWGSHRGFDAARRAFRRVFDRVFVKRVRGREMRVVRCAAAARRRSPHFKRSARLNLLRASCPSPPGKNASSIKPSRSRCRTPSRLSGAIFFHCPSPPISYSCIPTSTYPQTWFMAACSWSVAVRSAHCDTFRKWLNTFAVVSAQPPLCLDICGGCCMHTNAHLRSESRDRAAGWCPE